jgi:DNA-binding NarL/FixJ family response regulator
LFQPNATAGRGAGAIRRNSCKLREKQINDRCSAIQTVLQGEVYVSPETSRKTLLEYGKGTKRDLLATLSPRQREVLTLIAEGRTTKQIAQVLKISVKTVETHRAQLMERLDIHDVAGLVRYAIMVGVIEVE